MEYDDLDSFVTEFSENISEGGLFIKTLHPRKKGTQVNIEIELGNNGGTISAVGEVVRVIESMDSRPELDVFPGMAVRFIWLADESREIIRRIIGKSAEGG